MTEPVSATVDLRADIPAIVNAAGVTFEGAGHETFWIVGNTLFVRGCTQAALDAAVAGHDVAAHMALVANRAEWADLDSQMSKKAARFLEDIYRVVVDGEPVPQGLIDKYESIVSARKAKRAARP